VKSQLTHFGKTWLSRRNIGDTSATPLGIKREWYVCMYEKNVVPTPLSGIRVGRRRILEKHGCQHCTRAKPGRVASFTIKVMYVKQGRKQNLITTYS
jgi:hypothetical protein